MDLLSYATALVLVAAAPGPVVAILLARALAGQQRAAACFAAGVILGKLVTLAAVAGGLVLWLGQPARTLLAAKLILACYLLTIVLQLWNRAEAPGTASTPTHGASGRRDLAAGVAAGIASPLSLLFFVTLFPGDVPAGDGGWRTILAAAAVTAAAPGLVFGAYVLLACRLQRWLDKPRHGRLLHRAMALMIGGTAAWMLLDLGWTRFAG